MNESGLKVALAGNPNSGKSSVFNRLTGLQQKVGNFPGVTVDKLTGHCLLPGGQRADLVDLPGVYSLYPHDPRQDVTLNLLLDPAHEFHPDLVVYVADAANLERHLLLFTQICDLGLPCILGLNMVDLAGKSGYSCDVGLLERELGVPVVRLNGRTGEGVEQLKAQMADAPAAVARPFVDAKSLAPQAVDRVSIALGLDNAYSALLIAHQAQHLDFLSEAQRRSVATALEGCSFDSLHLQVNETMRRYDEIGPILGHAIRRAASTGDNLTDRLDAVLTHRIWGTLIFFAVLFLIFQAMFAWASLPMDWMDQGITWSRQVLADRLPTGFLSDLLVDGLIPGIGGILIFIPQIAILFLLVALLEEVGYMARAVYLSDNLMRRFGLNGRSFVALISGVACAVPAVMTARNITNRRERLATIFVTPFMSCSARLPVFALLIAFAVPDQGFMGGMFNLQGLAMFGMYLLGATAALGSAWVIKQLYRTGGASYLMLELPSYKSPHWRNVALTVWNKVRIFVFNAGKIILVISLILWVLSAYGPGTAVRDAEATVRAAYNGEQPDERQMEDLVAARKLEASWAGHLGKAIEPAIAPLGFDWKIGIALITSFAAREVFVGTMATIYSAASSDDKATISEYMRNDRNPDTGKPIYTMATAMSLLLFYVFAMQCMSTLAIVRRETNSWRIPLVQFLYMTGLAYLVSLVVYQLLK